MSGLSDWLKTTRPVSQLVKVAIQALAMWLSGKADQIPFERKHGEIYHLNLLDGLRDRVVREVAKSQLNAARKGRFGEGVQSMLKFLDGKKTWIGILATHGPILFHDVVTALTEGGVDMTGAVKIAGLIFMVLGSLHKLLKGE